MTSPSSAAGSFVQLHTPNNSIPTFLDTFYCFSKLAPELRLKIWNDSLPDPRIVEVEVWDTPDDEYEWWASAESKHQPCGLLLASKESRYVYLKHWLPIFRYVPLDVKLTKDEINREQMVDVDISDSRFPVCYFNPKIDMLYLGPWKGYLTRYNSGPIDNLTFPRRDTAPFATGPLGSLAAIPTLQQLRRLGCEFEEWAEVVQGFQRVDDYNKNFLLFPRLEEFIIGAGDLGCCAMCEGKKTKPSGEIELVEIHPDEWALSDDDDGPSYFDWWWDSVKMNNFDKWQAPSFSLKRVLRGSVSPQFNLTGWNEEREEEEKMGINEDNEQHELDEDNTFGTEEN
jgi:hypothetical protein